MSHSLLAPSSADRWTRCPGSVLLCKDIPSPPSEASALGTAKHETQYWCLMHSIDGKTADGLQGQPWTADDFAGTIDDEFVEHVNYCLTAIRAIPGTGRWFELPLDTSPVLGVPDQSGTADAVIEDQAARVLNVVDSKFGYGYVDAEENRQLLLYAAAALAKFDEFGVLYDTVRLWILQPKCGEPRMWETTAENVRVTVSQFALEAQEAMKPDAPLIPGDVQCKWCPVRANCAARANAVTAQFPIESSNGISESQLSELLNAADAHEAFWRDIRAEALRRAQSGFEIPGYKLVEGRRGARRWIDESVAAMLLEPQIDPWKKTLVTPTEAEKRLKKAGKSYAEVAAIVDQAPGAPSLARWSENAPALPRTEFGTSEEAE